MKALAAFVAAVALWTVGCAVGAAPPSDRAHEIQAQVGRILASPEFRNAPRNTALQRLGEWLLELGSRIMQALAKLFGLGKLASGSWMVVVLYVGLILAIAWGLSVMVRNRRWRVAQPPATAVIAAVVPLPEDVPDSAERLLALSHELAASGEWRRAFRAAYLAMLLLLSEAGVIRFDPSRTNGEYLREASRHAEGLALLRPITNEFNRLIYGDGAVRESEWREAMGAATAAKEIACR